METMASLPAAQSYVCQACGAALEVRVRFKGRIVWTVERDDPDFGSRQPQLDGQHQDPKLVCSADVMHETGFRLEDGQLIAGPKADD
jgi:hypothetical protein